MDTTATKNTEPTFDEDREELERRINLRSKILAESIAGYRLLADNATDLITRTTVDGRRVYASPSSRRVLGYTPSEMTGLAARALIHPDDRQTVATASSLLRGREADHQVIQYRARHKNGHWVWVEAAQQLVKDADEPDCLDIISVIRDISERRRLEEELRASEARLAAIFNNSTAGIVLVRVLPGPRFVYEAINPAQSLRAGFTPEGFIGRQPHDVFPASWAEQMVARYRRCVEEEVTITYEDTLPYPHGARTNEVTLVPIREGAEVARILINIHDTTEQKHTEAALRQAQKLEALGQLTGGVAHDFNNLLTAIAGNLELTLSSSGLTVRQEKNLRNALKGAERAAVLTQRLLAFARRQQLRPEAVDIRSLLTSLEDLLKRTLGPNIDLSISAAGELSNAKADPNQLELSVINLAVNARDAMPSGGRLRIHAEGRRQLTSAPDLEPGSYIVIAVSDNGTGMDAATLARVFEPFFTTKGVGKGSGLGLPMVQGFMTQSGGTIRVRSEPGTGTTFELWFPEHPDGAAGKPVIQEHRSEPQKGRTARILVCDDDADVRRVIVTSLREGGHIVRQAETPSAALELLQGMRAVDALVTDYAMPEMNGVELIERARRLQPSLKVLVVTGHPVLLRAKPTGLAVLG